VEAPHDENEVYYAIEVRAKQIHSLNMKHFSLRLDIEIVSNASQIPSYKVNFEKLTISV
jgi:hypothetical protein